MKMMEKILLPTDFSVSSRSAMEMAIALAKSFNSEIVLLHVLPYIPKSQLVMDMLRKTAHDQFSAIRKKINSSGVKTSEPIVTIGKHYGQIIKIADSQDVNLIIMGSGEKEKDERFKLGITTEKVIQKSNKPVWVMKRDMSSQFRRIICPIDYSEPSRRALKNAIHLAREFRAELTVLTVIDPITDTLLGLDGQLTSKQRIIAEKQTTKFEYFLKEFDFHNINLLKVIYQGKPYQKILKTIKTRKNDLLVMGTNSRSGLATMLMESTTEKVTREVPCSFITVKAENVIRLRLEAKIHDLETNFIESKQLLSKGFAKEALKQFQLCLNIDCLYIPAWEGMAKVYERLGNREKAQNCRKKVKEIRNRIWDQKVEAEIRSRHWLVRKM